MSESTPAPEQNGDGGYPRLVPADGAVVGDPVAARVGQNGQSAGMGAPGTVSGAASTASTAPYGDTFVPVDPNAAPPELSEGEPPDHEPPAGEPPDGEPPHEGSPGGPEPKQRSSAKLIREIAETVIMAVLIFLAVRAVVQNFKVEGLSMSPTFYDGEFLLVNKAVYARIDLRTVHKFLPFVSAGNDPEKYIFHGPQRGDVIVFHPPPSQGGDAKDYIKRVVGLPGDTVDVRDNHVFVNGRQIEEPYISVPTQCGGQYCHVQVGPGQYYVMGDNRTNSSDSRFWGPASGDKIIGKALFVYWCGGKQCSSGTDRIGFAPNHDSKLAPATP